MDGRGGAFFADEIDDDTVLGSDDGIFAWTATYVGVFAGFGQADNRIIDVDGFANWGNPGSTVDYDTSGFIGGADREEIQDRWRAAQDRARRHGRQSVGDIEQAGSGRIGRDGAIGVLSDCHGARRDRAARRRRDDLRCWSRSVSGGSGPSPAAGPERAGQVALRAGALAEDGAAVDAPGVRIP